MAEQVNTASAANPQPVNPLDLQQKAVVPGSSVVEHVVSQSNSTSGGILGAAPTIDSSLLQNLTPPPSPMLSGLKIAFISLIVLTLGSLLFFTSQLTTKLDFVTGRLNIPNASQKLDASNKEVISLKTDVNLYRILQIKAAFDSFSNDGDAFLQAYETANSQTVPTATKNSAKEDMTKARERLRTAFIFIRENYLENFTAPIVDIKYEDPATLNSLYEQELRLTLNQRAEALDGSENEQARRDNRNYRQAIKLVGNTDLRDLLINTDFDGLDDTELYSMVKLVNSLIVNDLSLIQKIKDTRIKWSDVINEIQLRTSEVDIHYAEDYFKEVGGIRYTSYDFDSRNKRLSIIGESKTYNTKTFTMIADLIETLNDSDFFENAEMRSFSKSGSLEDGFTATLKISVDLQGAAVAAGDETLDLTGSTSGDIPF